MARTARQLAALGSRLLSRLQGLIEQLFTLVQALAPFEYFQLPGPTREALFYQAGGADPAVVAVDNLTMDWWSNGELFSTFFAFLDPRIDQPWLVNGKVLIQVSRNDK